MGQRTQALVTVIFDGEVKTSFSLHYQWGHGRTMLMDVLRTAIFLEYSGWDNRHLSKREVTEKLVIQSIGNLNFACDMEEYEKEIDRWVKEPYNETLEEVMNHSDNNNGYIHLQVSFKGHESTKEIRFYDNEEKEHDFDSYCKQSGNKMKHDEKSIVKKMWHIC